MLRLVNNNMTGKQNANILLKHTKDFESCLQVEVKILLAYLIGTA
jgi:hypothetical protein